ncbi:MAG: Npt1/Npt2 family nucleotide transporter [Myxococcaceae bacterium]
MTQRLAGAMGLRPGEGSRTLRLFAFVFLFTSTAVLARSAQRDIFLAVFDRSAIADAFLWSALASIAASFAVMAVAGKLGVTRLVQLLLWLSATVFTAGALAVRAAPQPAAMVLYVCVEVLLSLLLAQGWAVATDAVDVRSAKRLLPVVGLGAGVAWTLGGFVVGALGKRVPSTSLLLMTPVLLATASWMVTRISAKDVVDVRELVTKQSTTFADGLRYLLSEPLMRMLAALITVELVVERITDFQLLSAAQTHFAGSPGGVASFMGLFYGVTGAVTLAAPFVFSGKILSRYGSARALLAAQVWVLITAALFLIFPLFSVIVLLSGGDRILKQALSGSARAQILSAVPSVRRAQAHAILRGVLAAFFSALAAVGLKALPSGFAVQWLSVPTLLLLAGLLVLTWNQLRKSYVLALQRSVDHRKLDLDGEGGARLRSLDGEQMATLRLELETEDEDRVLFALSILASAESARPLLVKSLSHQSPSVRAAAVEGLARTATPADTPALIEALGDATEDIVRCAALRALAELGASDAAPLVKKLVNDPSPRVRALARACFTRWEELRLQPRGDEGFVELLQSPREEERVAAAWAISQVELGVPRLASAFLPLLADASVAVRQAALKASGQFHDPAIVRALVFALEDPQTSAAAHDAFPLLDDSGVARIAQVLTDAPASVVSWTAAALSQAQSGGATELLKTLLGHTDAQVRYRASRALILRRRLREWAPPPATALLKAIEAELARGYAYYAPLIGLQASILEGSGAHSLETAKARQFMAGELDSRIQETERRILALIALIADPRIARLSHHLRDASPQVTARLLELLEQSLDAELSALVVPFLERQDSEARARTASEQFHVPERFREDPLAGIIDLNDPHLRRCALLVYGDRIAAKYPELLNREEPLLPLVERIRFLRSVPLFKALSPEDLMKLAEIAESEEHLSGEYIFKKGDPGDVLCVVVRGKVEIRDQNLLIATQGPNDFFGELALFDHEPRSADAVATEDTELLEIGGADLDALMERRPEIAREVIRVLARRLRKTTQSMIGSRISSPGLPSVVR